MTIKTHLFHLLLCCTTLHPLCAQDESTVRKLPLYKQVQSRARDHFMVQFGYMNWSKVPDSIFVAGFNRQFKFHGMYDVLIKGFPYMSVALGAGFDWDNMYFGDTKIDLTPNEYNTIQIGNHTDRQRYRKSKITTLYFEIPFELRFCTNIRNYNKGIKIALGLTYGYLLNAYSKGVGLLDAAGSSVNTAKTVNISTNYFNSSKIMAQIRVGWGFFHVYGTYQFGSTFTGTGGPDVSPYSIGIGLNGL